MDSLFSFDGLATILGLAIAGWLFYKMYIKKVSFDELVISNAGTTFKVVQLLSTVLETVGLSIIAMERGTPTFTALSRYILIGGGEILLTVYFIMKYEQQLRKACSDGFLTVWELIKIVLFTFPAFFAAFYLTNQIHLLYLESINIIELTQDVNAWMPFFGSSFESDPTFFTSAMRDTKGALIPPGRFEYGAWVMIYATPIFNVIGVMFITSDVIKESKLCFSRPKAAKTTTTPPPPKLDLKGLQTYMPLLNTALNIDSTKFLLWVSGKIGMDVATKAKVSNALTNAEVTAGRMTSDAALKELSDELVGLGTSTGLAYLQTLTSDVEKYTKQCNVLLLACQAIDKQRNDPATLAAQKSNLNVDYNGKKGEAKAEMKKLTDSLTLRGNVINDVFQTLELGNFKDIDKNFIDKMSLDAEQIVTQIATLKP